jgi:hypothetical protein
MFFALFYDYVPDILERRTPFRPAHLALATEYHEAGLILLAGAFAEPLDGALFVFRTDDRGDVERFIERDPFVQNGLVVSHRIRPWTVVIGAETGT